MPGLGDYLFLFAIYAAGFSFSVSLIALSIIAFIKRKDEIKPNYLKLWLKIFLILFIISWTIPSVFFMMG